MSGRKYVAIISEAASSGVSLQADRRVKNQRQRVHITLELPWAADKAIQQLGRSHRSNQTSAPHYKLLISPIGGERRFASAVAKRLESLGALLQGDRRAAVGSNSMSMSNFNFDTKYGREALNKLLDKIAAQRPGATANLLPDLDAAVAGAIAHRLNQDLRMRSACVAHIPELQHLAGQPLKAEHISTAVAFKVSFCLVGVDCAHMAVKKFFNRILGLEVVLQNMIFAIFSDFHDSIIRDSKKNGTYDQGIMELGNNGVLQSSRLVHKAAGETHLLEISVDRGCPWAEAETFVSEGIAECTTKDALILAEMKARALLIDKGLHAPFRQFKLPQRVVGFYRSKGLSRGEHLVIGVVEKPSVFEVTVVSTSHLPSTPLTLRYRASHHGASSSFSPSTDASRCIALMSRSTTRRSASKRPKYCGSASMPRTRMNAWKHIRYPIHLLLLL